MIRADRAGEVGGVDYVRWGCFAAVGSLSRGEPRGAVISAETTLRVIQMVSV